MFGILLLSSVAAAPSFFIKQATDFDVKVSCENAGGFCSGASVCFLTTSYPNSTVLINNQSMTNSNNGYFNYTLSQGQTSVIGEYSARTGCEDGNASATTTFTYEVNPTGLEATSVLDNPEVILLFLLSLTLLGLGIYFENSAIGFMGSVTLLLSGIYTMIYGLNNVTNLYTQGVGITLIALSLIFMFASAFDWLNWGESAGGEESGGEEE